MDNDARPLTFGLLSNSSLDTASSCSLLNRLRFVGALPYPIAVSRTRSLLFERFDGIRGTAFNDVVVSDEVRFMLRRVKEQKLLLLCTDGILLPIGKLHAVPTIPVSTVIIFLCYDSRINFKTFFPIVNDIHKTRRA